MTDIGVIIPAYNAARFVGATLEGVLRQTYQDWVCIVVDDGSTDETRAVIEGYGRRDARIQILVQENRGLSGARNAGMEALPPVRYVAFIDADDVWLPEALSVLHGRLEEHPEAVAAAGLPWAMDEDGRPMESAEHAQAVAFGAQRYGVQGWRIVPWREQRPSGLATFAVWCHVATPGLVLVRSNALAEAGPFRHETTPSEDWDLWLRLSLLGPILHVPALVMFKREVAGSLSRQGPRMKRAEPALRRLWAHDLRLTRSQRHILRVGHFYGALIRFVWARASLRQGHFLLAIKQMRQAVLSLGQWVVIEVGK